jgi:beta-phosphoglucomutase-like phosphatase (HAD superfamily)
MSSAEWSAYLRDELGDSSNGLRAAHAAGMIVIATPNHAFPPAPDALGLAAVVVDGIKDVTPEVVASL